MRIPTTILNQAQQTELHQRNGSISLKIKSTDISKHLVTNSPPHSTLHRFVIDILGTSFPRSTANLASLQDFCDQTLHLQSSVGSTTSSMKKSQPKPHAH